MTEFVQNHAAEERENKQVAHQYEPHVAAEGEHVSVVEEPHLRENESGCSHHPCRRLKQRHEREEPDEVLR